MGFKISCINHQILNKIFYLNLKLIFLDISCCFFKINSVIVLHHSLIVPCPCAVTTNPNLIDHIMFNGKCYLFYWDTAGLPTHTAAQNRCKNPTSATVDNGNGCGAGGSACTTSGVGRLSSFLSWTDYVAITGQAPSYAALCQHFGLVCDSSGHLLNENPYGACLQTPLNPPWPTPVNCNSNGYSQVFLGSAGFDGKDNQMCDGYVCEAGKIAKH